MLLATKQATSIKLGTTVRHCLHDLDLDFANVYMAWPSKASGVFHGVQDEVKILKLMDPNLQDYRQNILFISKQIQKEEHINLLINTFTFSPALDTVDPEWGATKQFYPLQLQFQLVSRVVTLYHVLLLLLHVTVTSFSANFAKSNVIMFCKFSMTPWASTDATHSSDF